MPSEDSNPESKDLATFAIWEAKVCNVGRSGSPVWIRTLSADLPIPLSQSKRTLGKNGKSGAQLFAVAVECRRYQVGFTVWIETREPDKQDARVNQMLAEDKLSEIFVRSRQDGAGVPAVAQNRFIVGTRVKLGNI